jgi:hypothetical protein
MSARPTDNSPLDEDRGLVFRNIQQEIHLHSRKGLKGAFEPASLAREIQCLVNLMEVALMDEGAGKLGLESGMLSHYHKDDPFLHFRCKGLSEFSVVEYADVVPAVSDSNDSFFWRYCLLEAQCVRLFVPSRSEVKAIGNATSMPSQGQTGGKMRWLRG